ncbi:MAG TPA: AraC family transcriptional regulator [Candidatus Omnitrophota bacterium]|jgi:AraC-like DNA-binding protein|nr:AraC family transcriptional regulator [Candidatus Omnitrophota bacterium]
MRDNILLHYLTGNKSYHLLRQLINTFYGFDLELLTLEGEFIDPPSERRFRSFSGLEAPTQTPSSRRFFDQDILQQVQDSRHTLVTECKERGYKQLFVPVLQKRDVVGFVFVSEDGNVRLTDAEVQITIEFLADYIRMLVKTDLEFIEFFQNKDMSHQQCVIHDVINYVQEHYQETHLTLRDIASWRGISYHYLSSLFKKEIKMPFKTYLTHVRLERAAHLLQSRHVPVGQVARECGFEDPGYFSKAFKRQTGLSPLAYREHPVQVKTHSAKGFQCALSKYGISCKKNRR